MIASAQLHSFYEFHSNKLGLAKYLVLIARNLFVDTFANVVVDQKMFRYSWKWKGKLNYKPNLSRSRRGIFDIDLIRSQSKCIYTICDLISV